MKYVKDKEVRRMIVWCSEMSAREELSGDHEAAKAQRYDGALRKGREKSAREARSMACAWRDLQGHLELMIRNRKIMRKCSRVAEARRKAHGVWDGNGNDSGKDTST